MHLFNVPNTNVGTETFGISSDALIQLACLLQPTYNLNSFVTYFCELISPAHILHHFSEHEKITWLKNRQTETFQTSNSTWRLFLESGCSAYLIALCNTYLICECVCFFGKSFFSGCMSYLLFFSSWTRQKIFFFRWRLLLWNISGTRVFRWTILSVKANVFHKRASSTTVKSTPL